MGVFHTNFGITDLVQQLWNFIFPLGFRLKFLCEALFVRAGRIHGQTEATMARRKLVIPDGGELTERRA